MPPFSLDQYLQSREQLRGQTKLDEIAVARDAKTATLADTSAVKQEELAAQAPKPWVDRLGLKYSLTGDVVNLGASVFSGAARVAGDILSLAPDAVAAAQESTVTPAQFDAYNRSASGKAQPGDAEVLTAQVLKQIQQVNATRGVASDINKAFDVSSVVNKRARTKLSKDLGNDFDAPWEQLKQGWASLQTDEKLKGSADVVSGLAKLVYNAAESAAGNPQAVAEYVAENAPQLAIGLVGKAGKLALTGSNVGYALENYRKGIEEYQAKNQGQFPSAEQRQYMAMMAASTGLAEIVGDASLLKGFKKAGDEAVAAARTGFKNSILGTAQAGGKGLVTESITEGYQTFAEGEAGLKPASASEIYEGAVIGGLSGGALAGGGRGVAELASAVVADAVKREEVQAAVTTAETTGDVAALVNPTTATFDPGAAITALQAFAVRKDTTFVDKVKAKGSALDALSQLDAQAEELLAQTPRGNKTIKADLAAAEAELKAADPADATAVAELTAERDTLKRLADLPVLQGKELEQNLAKYKELDDKVNTLSDLIGSIDTTRPAPASAPKVDEFETNLAAASAKVDLRDPAAVEVAQASATRIINLSMQAPGSLAPDVALKLANDKDNALSPAQRQHLRIFSEAQVALNALKTVKSVNKEVIFGDDATKQVGILTYERRLASALEAGHQSEAARQIKGITKFLASHAEKALAVREAFTEAQEFPDKTDPGFKVERTTAGEWTVTRVEPGTNLSVLRSELKKNGGSRIHKGSEAGFVIPVEQEAQAIKLAQASMQSAFNLAFAPGAAAVAPAAPSSSVAPVTSTTTGAPNVPVVPPAPKVTAPAVKAPKAVTPPAAPGVAAGTEAAPVVSGTGTTTVEAAGVVETQTPVEATKPVVVEEAKPTKADDKAQEAETEEVGPDPADDTTEAQDAPATVAAPAAWLAPVIEGKPEGKDQDTFTTTNLLRRVKQTVGNEKQGTVKPLASMPDFLSTWIEKGNKTLAKLLPTTKTSKWDETKKAAAKVALEHARDTIAAWTPLLAASMPLASTWEKLNPSYRQQDMAQFFATGVDEQGRAVVPENVLAAMAAAAYQWTLDQSNESAYLNDKQLAEMHGRPETTKLLDVGRQQLRKAVAFEDTVISDLGETALQMLGIQADKDTPRDFIPRLQNALGTHALLMLEQRGIIVRQSIQTKQVAIELFGEDGENIGPAAVNVYIALARDGKFTPAAEAKGIKEANKGSGGVVDLLFGSDKAPRFALTERSKFTQQFAKGTNQRITKKQAKAVQQAMDVPHTVIPEMLDLFLQLGRENVLKAAGWRDLESGLIHSSNIGAVEAQNLNLENQYDLAMEMMGLADLDNVTADTIKGAKDHKGWFITHEVWKNYRVGIATQSLNQQTSKIHRYLFQRPNWKATIDLTNPAQEQRFLISLGQNLGMKTDKQANSETVKLVQAKYLAEGTDAAKAADAIRAGNLSDESKALITKVAAKEGVVALQALQALAQYQAAKASGAKSFEVMLLVGADGKTNGPILTHLALGAAGSLSELKALLNRGGMFFKGDKWAHYSQFAADKGQDLYEDLSRHVLDLARRRITTQDIIDTIAKKPKTGFLESRKWITQEQFDAFQVISKELVNVDGSVTSAGRNLVKTPLTAFAFGSALSKATKSMEDAFVQSFYDSIEAIASGERTDTTLPKLVAAMNVLLTRGGGELLPVNPEAKGLTLELNKAQLKALGYAFDSVMGGPVKGAMESYFATFIERRRELNMTVGAAFDLYQVAYQAAKTQLIGELMESGDLPYTEPRKKINGVLTKTGERKPSRDLTGAEEQQLQDLLADLRPVMHTNFSKEEGNLEAGMFMAKSSMKGSQEDAYQNKVSVGGEGVSVADTKLLRDGPDAVSDNVPMITKPHLESRSRVRVEVAPGAAGTPGAIHSSDSSIMHKSLLAAANTQGLNVHDEVNTGVDHIDGAASAINEATVDTFLKYSPAAEARDMLERQLIALESAVNAGTLPASVVSAVGQLWADTLNAADKEAGFTADEALEEFPRMAIALAYRADAQRLGAMAEMTVMDQYTWEGGQFNVSEQLQAQAQTMLAELDSREAQERDAGMVEMASGLSNTVGKGSAMSAEGKALYDQVATLRKMYESKAEAALDPVDRTPKVKTTEAMGAPGVIAPTLVAALPGLPVALKEDVAKGTPVVAALNKLGTNERIQATEEISRVASRLPMEEFSIWGVIGDTPPHRHHPELVKFLSERGSVTAMEIYPVLKEIFATSSMNTGMVTLLNKVVRLAGPDFRIQYVTKDTPAEGVLERPVYDNSRGWYVAHESGKRVAYILGSEFEASSVHAEVVMHEILHEVLSGVIENPTTSDAKSLVSELEGLLALVRKHPEAARFGNATADVHELVSWGMTNRQFQAKVLSEIQVKVHTNKGNRLISGWTSFIKTMRAFLFGKLPTKDADKATNALTVLLSNTAGLFEAVAEENASTVQRAVQNRSQQAPSNPTSPLDKFKLGQDAVDRTVNAIRGAVGDLANSDPIKNSRFGPVRFGGAVVSLVAKDLTGKVLESGLNLRDQVVKDRQGFIAGVFNSLQGPAQFARELLRMAKKNEQHRKQMIENTANMVMAGFRDGSRMTDDTKSAVTRVFLRSGMHVLLGQGSSMADIQNLLNSPAALETAIKAKVGELGAFRKERHYYDKQAKALAYLKVAGTQRLAGGMLNAGNIAKLYGTPLAGTVDAAQAQAAEKVIEALVALYSIHYQDKAVLDRAKAVLDDEMARPGKENGIEQVLLLQKEMDRQAREKLFQGGSEDALRTHGYTPEIYNPNTALRTARTPEERTHLEETGFKLVYQMPKDKADPDQVPTYLYSLEDGGSLPYLTGATSLKGLAAKGNARYGEVIEPGQIGKILKLHTPAIMDSFKPDPGWDPSKAKGVFMTPVLNAKGQVTNWRYLMSEANKDKLLERDNRVDYVLGTMAGNTFDKESSKVQNYDVVQSLFETYQTDYKNRPASYVEISPNSSNAEMRELYALLPDTMQRQIKEVWGPRGMKVPYELLDVVFGYRKLTAAKPFDKMAANRLADATGEARLSQDHLNALEQAVVVGTELSLYTWARGIKGMSEKEATTWSRAAGVRVRRSERAWQEIVQEIKDTIVVRGITTMVGNIKSNISFLVIQGVNPITAVKNMRVAWKGAVDFKRDHVELSQLKAQLASGYTLGNDAEMKKRVAELERSIAANPVRDLIEGGLLPAIVEDVATDFDPYSYKSLLSKKAEKFTSKINPGVRTAGRWIYMTHDTQAYKTLAQITQLSDFVSRYALHQHLISRKKNPLTSEQAIEEASESFVNYDIPMHRSMQYLDDMGITMFTKYFLQIQRVLLKLGREKPIQVLIAAALHQYFGRLDLVVESGLPYRFGIPNVKGGPFEAFDALGQLPAAMITNGLLGNSSGGEWPQ